MFAGGTSALADESLASELGSVGANVLAFGPFGLLSYGLKKQAKEQEECYNAGECLDAVSYYRIQCERDDTECLARKRRLASQEANSFLSDPGSSPGFLFFALLLFSGPVAASIRTIAGLVNPSSDDDDDEPPSEPPRKSSYGPGLPW